MDIGSYRHWVLDGHWVRWTLGLGWTLGHADIESDGHWVIQTFGPIDIGSWMDISPEKYSILRL